MALIVYIEGCYLVHVPEVQATTVNSIFLLDHHWRAVVWRVARINHTHIQKILYLGINGLPHGIRNGVALHPLRAYWLLRGETHFMFHQISYTWPQRNYLGYQRLLHTFVYTISFINDLLFHATRNID